VKHGGVRVGYAADNALTFAAGTVLGASVLTSGLTISYLRGAQDGVLRATTHVVHHTARQAVCTVEVAQVASDGAIRVCAIAQGTVAATEPR